MKRIMGTWNRQKSLRLTRRDPVYPDGSPEAILLKEVTAFCESGNGPNQGRDDYLHLPAIVEAAESSPNAAREAALRIRKYLSNPAKSQGYVQYNAIMLIRILSDNPGHTFTRNIDSKFVATVKELLREGRDASVHHILRETLTIFETQKTGDGDLAPLIAMWKHERKRPAQQPHAQPNWQPGPNMTPQQNTTRPSRSGTLPPPDELAARVAEAKTSATLLIQLIQSTPSNEIPSNDLIKEFSDRCQSASRSLQGFMQCKNPPPDDNTLLTLIETNDQLSVATSKYQRAILTGRKAQGVDNSPSPPLDGGISAVYMRQAPSPLAGQPEVGPVPEPPPLRTASSTRNGNIRYQYNPDEFQVQNPFADGQVASDSPDEISTISGGQNNKADHGLFHRGTDTLFR